MKTPISDTRLTFFGHNAKNDNQTISTLTMKAFLERITHDTKEGYILRYRTLFPDPYDGQAYDHLKKIPRVCAASTYKRDTNGRPEFVALTGIVPIVVKPLNKIEVEDIKQQAALVPQTLAAITGANERSVIIFALASLPDGSLPDDKVEAEGFLLSAYRKAVMCYAPQLSVPISIEEPHLDGTFLMTVDEKPFINDYPSAFIISRSSIGSKATLPKQGEGGQALYRLKPDTNEMYSLRTLFQAALHNVQDHFTGYVKDQPEAFIPKVAELCAKCGMPEEEVARGLMGYFWELRPTEVRGYVREMYDMTEQKTTRRSLLPKKQLAALQLREFLHRRYDIRYNELAGITEYRQRYSLCFMFEELTKRSLNTIRHEAALEGIEAFESEVSGLINSDYTPVFNPVEDYLGNLPRWDGGSYIDKVASMVPNDNPHWPMLFRRWFLSMVAHWLGRDREHGNSTAPILIGEQGYRKSTFCRILLPPELRSYFTDSIDFRTKIEAERVLSKFLLVNIDEFDQLNEGQFAFLKHLFQKPSATIRRSYSTVMEHQRRYASFIGTSNQQEILRDPTGNRRYLCINVTAPIHMEEAIDYEQLYAEAVEAIYNHERYWLDDTDEALIRESNKPFEAQSPLEQLLRSVVDKAIDEKEGEWMRPIEIMALLREQRAFTRKMDNLVTMGRVLTKMRFEKKPSRLGAMYLVKVLTNKKR